MTGTADPRHTAPTGNVWLEGLLWGEEWSSGGRPTVVSTYIAGRSGDEILEDGQGGTLTAYAPLARESAAITSALTAFEAVCGIEFRLTSSASSADLVWAIVDQFDGRNAYGWSTPPGLGIVDGEAQSLVAINYESYNPDSGPNFLAQGGFNTTTMIHELGHAVGLAHPHDTGGGSRVFPGVTNERGDLGRFDMNQGVFTMMSYNNGWPAAPQGSSSSAVYGYQAGPMALDIAALQRMYGANTNYRTGRDAYALPGANKVGTFYACLWDAGGADRILGASERANSIDLRAATLDKMPGGGGYLSYAEGIHGGFTIARGVTIEDARGGQDDDEIRGNSAGNGLRGLGGQDELTGSKGEDRLEGGAGRDVLFGGRGGDVLIGGTGADRLRGGDGRDEFVFKAARDSAPEPESDQVIDFTPGQDRIVLSGLDADWTAEGNQEFQLASAGSFEVGEIRQSAQDGHLLVEINLDLDPEAEMAILVLDRMALLGAGDFML